jgi:hypothetical protein
MVHVSLRRYSYVRCPAFVAFEFEPSQILKLSIRSTELTKRIPSKNSYVRCPRFVAFGFKGFKIFKLSIRSAKLNKRIHGLVAKW